MAPRFLLPLLVLILLVLVPSAHAAIPLRLTAPATTTVPCQDGLATGKPGVATHQYAAQRAEALTVKTDGGGDWDLALFDQRTGTRVGASATSTSKEVATALLRKGQAVTVQLCRRSGDAGSVSATLDGQALPAGLQAPSEVVPPQLVSVPVPSKAAASRLAALELDVSHNVRAGRADIVVYNATERQKLENAGFAVTTKVADLPALDRRALDAAPSTRALPSGRTTYRDYADFGTDLKEIADANPGHVKLTTLPGESLEGRPFEGVEIAAGAGRPDDGRPIFLLTGNTHAREWPGGEASIEFAIDMAESYGSDPRVTELLQNVRIFVFPMLNPDGFVVSRTAGAAFAPATTGLT